MALFKQFSFETPAKPADESGAAIVSSSGIASSSAKPKAPDASAVQNLVENVLTQLQQTARQTFSPFPFDAPEVPARVKSASSTKTAPLPLVNNNMVTGMGPLSYNAQHVSTNHQQKQPQGGNMVDLSAYKDLTEAPETTGNGQTATLLEDKPQTATEYPTMSSSTPYTASLENTSEMDEIDIYGEYSGNVKTLVQLVNDLPEGVTKQTGAQIIRLTMEAMGISMETVLSDAQAVQSQLLDAVRANIKKIEEYKTVIRKLETEIRFHQGKANELSEIIDLFILSNASPKMPNIDG